MPFLMSGKWYNRNMKYTEEQLNKLYELMVSALESNNKQNSIKERELIDKLEKEVKEIKNETR